MNRYSLLNQLALICEQEPDLPALIDAHGACYSRRQLMHRVRCFAEGFKAQGLLPGDRVLFAVRPDAEAVLLMIGISEAGGVLVPIDTSMGPALFRSKMQLLAPRWVVAESLLLFASKTRWIARLLARRGLQLPPVCELSGVQFVRVGRHWPGLPRSVSYRTIEKTGESSTAMSTRRRAVEFGPEDPTMIVFTSGTTAEPKAVVHTRRSMQGVFSTIDSLLNMNSEDVLYARELHLILPALFAGASVVVPRRRRFAAKAVLKVMQEFRVSHYFSVAAELQQLLDHLSSRNKMLPPTLREIWIGAAPVHASFLQRLKTVLPADTKVWCVYGMTEILPVARVSAFEKARYQGAGDLVGRCVPGVTARIAENGELMLRGPNLFSGYFGETLCSEHRSGDLARMDDDQIVLLGRCKDMIIRRRFNIYPALYESTIEHIEGVRRCAMVGIYDERAADERVVLVLEPSDRLAGPALAKRVEKALRGGPCRIDAEALPDDIMVMTLPVSGRSSKIDKDTLREYARRTTQCA